MSKKLTDEQFSIELGQLMRESGKPTEVCAFLTGWMGARLSATSRAQALESARKHFPPQPTKADFEVKA